MNWLESEAGVVSKRKKRTCWHRFNTLVFVTDAQGYLVARCPCGWERDVQIGSRVRKDRRERVNGALTAKETKNAR